MIIHFGCINWKHEKWFLEQIVMRKLLLLLKKNLSVIFDYMKQAPHRQEAGGENVQYKWQSTSGKGATMKTRTNLKFMLYSIIDSSMTNDDVLSHIKLWDITVQDETIRNYYQKASTCYIFNPSFVNTVNAKTGKYFTFLRAAIDKVKLIPGKYLAEKFMDEAINDIIGIVFEKGDLPKHLWTPQMKKFAFGLHGMV